MNDKSDERERARQARLRSALRDNLKRRKSQAKGRLTGAIVTPEDEGRMSDDSAATGNGNAAMAALYPRHEQMFPTLTPREIERMRGFGEVAHYKSGEALFTAGKKSPGMFVLLSGHVAMTQRDGLGHVTPIAEQGPGQFLAEIAQLSGRPAMVDGLAEGDVEALVIPSERLRALLVAEAELGERIMRALILRRVGLIQGGNTGPVLIGARDSGDVTRLQGFMSRNGYPYHLLDPASDKDAADFVARHSKTPADLPLIVTLGGTVLRNPGEAELARAMGMISEAPSDKIYDVAIVGSGPAGLSTAVYAASEGLSAAVLDRRAFGGQAGASARIENYLGFPTGISGLALTARAFNQAQKFGAEMMIPVDVKKLECGRDDGLFGLELDYGGTLLARSIVVASGARYRRPDIEKLEKFEGRGVWYWASPIEAKLCARQEVVLVGGGNSAGQAAVFLAAHADRVRMMIRGDGLAASMSRYLIDRIAATANIELMTQTEIFALDGEDSLERVCWRNRKTGEETKADIRNVFMFIGADPATGWLKDCGVDLDRNGFVVTGRMSGEDLYRGVSALETSIAGVFAVGDVRAGSIKRVGGAIGEGAQVVAALHGFLDEARRPGV